MVRALLAFLAIFAALPAVAQTPAYHSYVDEFDRFAMETTAMPPAERVKAFRDEFNALIPGFYAPRFGATEEQYNARIEKALAEYPVNRDKFLAAARDFKVAYESGNARFKRFFPDYAPTVPIYLLHSIGEMDGGTRTIQGRTVAVFGADVIAKIYVPKSIGPFLDHELFHFHHHNFFHDCDAIWCQLWSEGLAVYVASRMNPGADDRALALTLPRPIRPEVEPRLTEAMCYTRARLESEDEEVYSGFFFGNGKSPFPPRFGYFVGYLLVQKIGEGKTLDSLAKLPNEKVKPLIQKALAGYSCPQGA